MELITSEMKTDRYFSVPGSTLDLYPVDGNKLAPYNMRFKHLAKCVCAKALYRTGDHRRDVMLHRPRKLSVFVPFFTCT